MIKQFIILLSLVASTQLGYAQELNKELAPVKWRNIGPFRGGRSNTATGVITNSAKPKSWINQFTSLLTMYSPYNDVITINPNHINKILKYFI
jgi:hypothetical protein